MKKYPIMITDADLRNKGILGEAAKINMLLEYTHLAFYDYFVYTTMKHRRKKLIEQNAESLEEDIKHILINIAWSIDRNGDFVGLDEGYQRKQDDSVEIKPLNERLIAVIPTVVWSQIAGLQPDICFCGGEI